MVFGEGVEQRLQQRKMMLGVDIQADPFAAQVADDVPAAGFFRLQAEDRGPGGNVLRVQGKRIFKRFPGCAGIIETGLGQAHLHPGIDPPGIGIETGFEVPGRVLRRPGITQANAEQVLGLGVLGRRLGGLGQGRNGGVVIPLQEQQLALVPVRG